MFLALNDDASAPPLNTSQLTAEEFVTGLAPSHQAEVAAPQPDAAKAASESAGTSTSDLGVLLAELGTSSPLPQKRILIIAHAERSSEDAPRALWLQVQPACAGSKLRARLKSAVL